MPIPFVDPISGAPLTRSGDSLVDPSGGVVARIEGGLPRFVHATRADVANFAWQWRRWGVLRTRTQASVDMLRKLILTRTQLGRYTVHGASLLECGCGSGDDTAVLLSMPFGEVHSFDLSPSVDQVARVQQRAVETGKLTLSQADITKIPYADGAFDVVYCHRVLQHTPDPEASLRSICRKVKPGGILFAHCYRRSALHMSSYKYKYRPLARRLPAPVVAKLLDLTAPALHALNERLCRPDRPRRKRWAYRWLPLHHSHGMWRHFGRDDELEMEKFITFDALMPRFDNPMTPEIFRAVIESEGFRIDHFCDNPGEPLLCTARQESMRVSAPKPTLVVAAA